MTYPAWPAMELRYVTEGLNNEVIFERKGGLRLWDESQLSIVSPAIKDAPTHWYNLQGIEIQKPLSGGIYIRRQGTDVQKVKYSD